MKFSIEKELSGSPDECTSPAEDFRYQEEALERTHRWAERSLEHHQRLNLKNPKGLTSVPALFGIVQGGREESLRKKSAEFIGSCPVCVNVAGRHVYSRAYLCHLYRAHEMLGGTLGSMHNLYFIINLVKRMRDSILNDTFAEFKKSFLEKYS